MIWTARLFLPTSLLLLSAKGEEECPIILHNLKNGGGVAVYAGRDFQEFDLLEVAPAISVPNAHVHATELNNFCEVRDDQTSLLSLGVAHLLNHADINLEAMVLKKALEDDEGPGSETATKKDKVDVALYVNGSIAIGRQIFLFYSPTWFAARNLDDPPHPCRGTGAQSAFCRMSPQAVYNASTRLPGCPSTMVESRPQQGGLFAKRDIKSGEIIEVTRGVLVPEDVYANAGVINSLLWVAPVNPWAPPLFVTAVSHTLVSSAVAGLEYVASTVLATIYSIAGYRVYEHDTAVRFGLAGRSPHAMLLYGQGSLYRGGPAPNILYYLYSSSDDEAEAQCSVRVLVAFEALRDVARDEELVVDLDTVDGRRVTNVDFARQCCLKSFPYSFRDRWENFVHFVRSYLQEDRIRRAKFRLLVWMVTGLSVLLGAVCIFRQE